MKQSEWKRVSAPLARELSEFRRVGRGFVLDDEWVSVCLFMDESRQEGGFYLQAFLLPLFIPTERIYLDYGQRLHDWRKSQIWSEFDDELLSVVADAVGDLRRPDALSRLQRIATERPLSIYLIELRLCLALLIGDDVGYRRCLQLVKDWNPERDFEIEVLERCRRVSDLVDLGGRRAALILFAERRASVKKILT